ncbi:hypothetical protein CBS101457_003312 [Exobasidium rhododendri]|nr:hypothetical protein CBS101457_003312 [Exobasidium rhododendri]
MGNEDDEFDDEFDDLPVDILEESLARLEESFNSQQGPHPSMSRLVGNGVMGTASKQPGRGERNTALRTAARSPGVDDYRVSHQGQVQGGSILPAGDDEFDDDGGMWRNMDLDRIDNEAIELSQKSQNGSIGAMGRKIELPKRYSVERSAQRVDRPAKRAREDEHGPAVKNITQKGREENFGGELAQDRKRIAELEEQLARKEEEIARFKKENRTKVGEVSVLRANMNKTVADFSSVLKEKEEAIAKQKLLNNEMKMMHEEQLARNETINAFRHTELATTARWSSITASVARRRGGPGAHSSQRNYSQSHSQVAAAAVGLTTPTRKKRGSHRNLGSGGGGSGGSGGETGRKATAEGEESPSSRRGQMRQLRQVVLDSALKTKPRTPAFPGFVNSFAKSNEKKPRSASKGQQHQDTNRSKPEEENGTHAPDSDDVVFQDLNPLQPRTETAERNDSAHLPFRLSLHEETVSKEESSTGWSHPPYRYLWAVSTYSKRLNFLSSLILSHTSSPCPSVSPHAITHSSTLYRLLNASLPPQTPVALQEQYVIATHVLLNMLSQGAAADAEDRFTYLLDRFSYEENKELEREERLSQDEEEYWACQMLMEEGLNDVLIGISSVLCTMMSISFQTYMVERLYDVLTLMRNICIHQPWMIHAILSTSSSLDSLPPSSTAAASAAAQLTDDVAGSEANHFEVELEKVIIACVQRLSASEEKDAGGESEVWPMKAATSESLLQVMVGIMEIMSYEVRDNDNYSLTCMHKLKRIIDEPGIVASLLNINRRDSITIRQTISLLIKLSQHSTLWRNVIACKIVKNPDPQRRANPLLSKSETPLLEMLARVLVDGRAKTSAAEGHDIHCDIVTLLSQLVVQHSDALVLVAESNSILAAIIKCLQIDTGLIWNDDGEEVRDQEDVKVINIVERICMDVRLMSHLYIYPKRPTNIAKKLQSHESHLLLNGIKHCFISSMSRVAFAVEPDWFDVSSGHLLGTVNESASNLLELILSPEEMESAWEMLNEEDEEEDEEREEEREEEEEQHGYEEEEDVESQTQIDQESGREVIVIS